MLVITEPSENPDSELLCSIYVIDCLFFHIKLNDVFTCNALSLINHLEQQFKWIKFEDEKLKNI